MSRKAKPLDDDIQRKLAGMLAEAASGNNQFRWLDALAEKAGYKRTKKRGRRSIHGDLERAAVRRAEMLKLKEEGWTITAIAEQVGVNKSNVVRGLQHELDLIARTNEGRAKHLRALELSRLDRILNGLWWKVQAGDTHAAAVALKIGERRARLLGLDLQPEPAAPPQNLNLNFVTLNDPKMQLILQNPNAVEFLHLFTENGNGNGHHATNGNGGGPGLAADAGDNGGEAEPGLPPLPPRQAPE